MASHIEIVEKWRALARQRLAEGDQLVADTYMICASELARLTEGQRELCVIFNRKPELKVLALVRTAEDARLFVEQKIAQLQASAEILPDDSPRLLKWTEAEWTTVSFPSEPNFAIPK